MTRRDFQIVADVLRAEAESWPMVTDNGGDCKVPVQSMLAGMRLAFVDALKETNPRFDEGRFLKAAQPRPDAYNERIERLRHGQ